MAIYERTGQLIVKNADGDQHILYPDTKISSVEGLPETLQSIKDVTIIKIKYDDWKKLPEEEINNNNYVVTDCPDTVSLLDMNDRLAELESEMEDCFQSVSDGKMAVAAALTKEGVATAFEASFNTMATNVAKVADNHYASGAAKAKQGDAACAHVLAGKTFTNKDSSGLTGTMPNRGTWTGMTSGSGAIYIPEGYHNGQGYVTGINSYNAGVADADARVNTSSASYTAGVNAGTSGRYRVAVVSSGSVTIGKNSTVDVTIPHGVGSTPTYYGVYLNDYHFNTNGIVGSSVNATNVVVKLQNLNTSYDQVCTVTAIVVY